MSKILCYIRLLFFSQRFSLKNADYSSDFLKTNELTDFKSFISWLALTLTATLLPLAFGIEVMRLFWGLPSRRTWVRVPPLTKIFLCRLFWLCETFFASFLNAKGSTLHFFLFCKRMDVEKLPKGPLLHFLALCDLPETKTIRKKSFKKWIFFNFFSRGYCRREYLTLWSPFAVFVP